MRRFSLGVTRGRQQQHQHLRNVLILDTLIVSSDYTGQAKQQSHLVSKPQVNLCGHEVGINRIKLFLLVSGVIFAVCFTKFLL